MNDGIKEILDYWQFYINEPNNYKLLNVHFDEVKKVLDYITNLQQEIERLRNEIKKISEQHIYTLDKLIETQTRIEKINEYIKENGYIDLNGYDLLNILGGDEE